MKVSFVIPAYDGFNLTNQILLDICTHSSSVDEVLILDNGSKDPKTQNGLRVWLGYKVLPLRVVRVEENVGFIRICNLGVPEAEHEAVALISNDVRIQSDLAKEIREKLNRYTVLGGVLYRGSTGWNEFEGVVYPYLEGWLLSFMKETWEEIGGFDEDFAPQDYEDVDFSTAARNLGCQLVQLEGTYRHLVAQTIGYNPERLAHTEQNQKLFREKWVS